MAAVAVVIAHTTIIGLYKVEPYWSYLGWSPLRVFWSGHQAVILFFVLSGFALSRMLEGMQGKGYVAYLLARVVRLYPPYLASLALALALYWLLQAGGFSWKPGWLNTVQPVMSGRLVADHLAMVGEFETTAINPPIWSLVHEMRLSVVFPLLFGAVLRWGWRALLGAAAFSLSLAAAAWSGKPGFLSWGQLSVGLTMHYGTFFVLGSLIAKEAASVTLFFERLSGRGRAALWLISLALYAYPFDNPWTIGQRALGDLVTGVGAVGLVGLALSMRSKFVLRAGGWLGEISYSLYLNHFVVLNAVIIVLFASQPPAFLWALTLACSLALAALLHRAVERPARRLSRLVRSMGTSAMEQSSVGARS